MFFNTLLANKDKNVRCLLNFLKSHIVIFEKYSNFAKENSDGRKSPRHTL